METRVIGISSVVKSKILNQKMMALHLSAVNFYYNLCRNACSGAKYEYIYNNTYKNIFM